jgi:hypothetical protein
VVKKFTNIFPGRFRSVSDVPVEKMWSVSSSARPLKWSSGEFDPGRTQSSPAPTTYNN